jgi:curli production assembly/transport component CsgG
MKWLILLILLSACATTESLQTTAPEVVQPTSYVLPPPERGRVIVAVYGYNDLTGQRAGTTLSTAVTQGAENFLIDALKEFSNGTWYRVVERKGIDNIVRERQIIRSARETVEPGIKDSDLPVMLYAGIIIEGGIVGYDVNTTSGGIGARIFGLGASKEYSRHTVTIALRAVSVATTEVVSTIIVEKEVLAYGDNMTVMKFFDQDTQTLELETGTNTNEASSFAIKTAIEKAVYELTLKGKKQGLW